MFYDLWIFLQKGSWKENTFLTVLFIAHVLKQVVMCKKLCIYEDDNPIYIIIIFLSLDVILWKLYISDKYIFQVHMMLLQTWSGC